MIAHLLSAISESTDLSTDKELADAVKLIELAENARKNALDTMICLHENGPLYDGDVPSKTERDWLVASGLAAKIVVKGQDGYQALTYKGRRCYQLYVAQKSFEVKKNGS